MGKLRFIALRIWVPIIGRLRMLRAWAALLMAMRRRSRATELWIGDSHALSFNQKVHFSEFVRGPEGQIILRVGPRLMWSLAESGFSKRVDRVARVVARLGRPGSIIPVFVSGEIDVRCHLVGREQDYGFVKTYVDRCLALAASLRSPRAVFVIPPPPSEWCPNVVEFPIKGTIVERVGAFRNLREALISVVEHASGAELLDPTDELAGPDGSLRRDYTDDGCHTNHRGVAVVRSLAHQMELTATRST
jgi:hypothetical protein